MILCAAGDIHGGLEWMYAGVLAFEAPRPTVFIKGNHEDFVWRDGQPSSEILPRLHYLRNGGVHELVVGDEVLRVGRVGGCFGPSNFGRRASTLLGYAKRHYTRDEIEALSEVSNLDIALTHDAPAGVRFDRHRRGEGFVSEAAGLDELLARGGSSVSGRQSPLAGRVAPTSP